MPHLKLWKYTYRIKNSVAVLCNRCDLLILYVIYTTIFKVLTFCGYALLQARIQLLKTLLEAFERDVFLCGRWILLDIGWTLERAFYENKFSESNALLLYTWTNTCKLSVSGLINILNNLISACCSLNAIFAFHKLE